MPVMLCQLYLDRLPWLAYISTTFAGIGVSAMYLLPWYVYKKREFEVEL